MINVPWKVSLHDTLCPPLLGLTESSPAKNEVRLGCLLRVALCILPTHAFPSPPKAEVIRVVLVE